MCIHIPPDAVDVVIRVQCGACLGHGGCYDRKLVPRLHMNPADFIECAACEGTGWLTEDEDEALPDSMRAD